MKTPEFNRGVKMKNLVVLVSLLFCVQSFASDCRYLDSLDEVAVVTSTDRVGTIKMPERFLGDNWDASCNVRVDEMTTEDGRTLIQLTTFEDECDGGNTYGYILEGSLEGEVLAEIHDGDLYSCKK